MPDNLMLIWSSNPAVSLVVWIVIAIVLLYSGRQQSHQLFQTTGRAIYCTMRLWAYSLSKLEKKLAVRNRQILLASGAKEAENTIEREFSRINNIVKQN